MRVVEEAYDPSDESAFIKLNNIREEDPAASQPAAEAAPENGAPPEGAEAPASPPPASHFDPEKVPVKIPLVKTKVEVPGTKLHGIKKDEESFKVAVYHSEASYAVRKFLIDSAKKHFVELEKAETSAILSHSYNHRYKQIEDLFEEEFIKSQSYNRGEQFQDQN